MKLVIINDNIFKYASDAPSAVGGAERQQWLLARALVAAGWSVTVAVSEGLEAGTRTAIDGVEFAGIGLGRGHILSAWYRFLSAENPGWCYWRGAYHLLGPAVEIAKLAGVRTIFSAAFDTDVRPRRALSWRSRWWPMYAWGLSRSDRIFVQHGGQRSELPRQWRHKASIVPSIAGIVTVAKPHLHREKYIAWVGMLRQPKRPDLLVEIAQRMPTIRFVVCGAPHDHRSPVGYGDQIVEKLRGLRNVQYLGQVPPDEAQKVIAEAAAFLSTSDGEGFPNTFLQAWSYGTPVVSLKIDPDHVIKRFKLGTLAASVEGAIADVRALINSPERREDIAVRARRYVETAHSEAVVIAAFESAIGNLPGVSTCSVTLSESSSPRS